MQVLGFVAFSSLCLTTGAFAPVAIRGQAKPLFASAKEAKTDEANKVETDTEWVREEFERVGPSDVFGSATSSKVPVTADYLDSLASNVGHAMQGEYHTPNMVFDTQLSPSMEEKINKASLPAMHGKNNALGELKNQFNSVKHGEMHSEVELNPQHFRHPSQGEHHAPNMMFNVPSSVSMFQEINKASLPAMHGKNTELGELKNQFDSVEHMDMQKEVDLSAQKFGHPMQGEYHMPNMIFDAPLSSSMEEEINKASLPEMHGKNPDLGELKNQFGSVEHMEMQTEVDLTAQRFGHPMQGEYHMPNMMFDAPSSPSMEEEINKAGLPAMHGKNTELGELKNQFGSVEHMEMQSQVDLRAQRFGHTMQGEYHTPNMIFNAPSPPSMFQDINKASLPAMHGKNTKLGEMKNQFDSVEHMEMQAEVDLTAQRFGHPMQGEYHAPNMMFDAPSSPSMEEEINKASQPAMHGKNTDLGELKNQFDSVEHIEIQSQL